uniref:Uncharacterized protein n=1 Tax=Plectus sambesii TaxID=2011161 RepID=A0A914VNK6_9BILA
MSPRLSALLLIAAIVVCCYADGNQPRPSAPRQNFQVPLGQRTKVFSWFPMSMKRGHPGAHFKHLLQRYEQESNTPLEVKRGHPGAHFKHLLQRYEQESNTPLEAKRGHPGAHFKYLLQPYEHEPTAQRQARTVSNDYEGFQAPSTIIPTGLPSAGIVNGR